MYIGIVKVQKARACQLDEIIITTGSSDVSACMALSSIQLTIIQAEIFFLSLFTMLVLLCRALL